MNCDDSGSVPHGFAHVPFANSFRIVNAHRVRIAVIENRVIWEVNLNEAKWIATEAEHVVSETSDSPISRDLAGRELERNPQRSTFPSPAAEQQECFVSRNHCNASGLAKATKTTVLPCTVAQEDAFYFVKP